MGILLIESSGKKIEFGYADDDNRLLLNEELKGGNNADSLIFYIKEVFDQEKIIFPRISTIVLSNGPGSFTGLRIGSSIAKGICFALNCKLIAIPTLEIIANKYKSDKTIVPMIFSNSKTMEFYFSEYIFESENIKRISEYQINVIENIITSDSMYLINEETGNELPEKFRTKIKNVSNLSGIQSMLELTKYYIDENRFDDYETSEPLYLKEFIPKF